MHRAAWQARLHHAAWSAQSNAGHRALVELERRGKLHAPSMQNVDELHRIVGNSPQRQIELHGTKRRLMCWSCGRGVGAKQAGARVVIVNDGPTACGDLADAVLRGRAGDLLARLCAA